MSRKMEKSRFTKYFCIAGLMTALASGAARAGDKPEDATAKAGEGAKSGTKALCDDEWYGGFWTIEVNQIKNDGKTPVSKPYNPQRPLEPWFAPEGQYFRMLGSTRSDQA